MRVRVALVPASVAASFAGWPAERRACAGVAIDVLRATTTLTIARLNGAREIVPFADPGAALAMRARDSSVLACGERDGRIVPGFDLGNSPDEYTPERVGGATLAFASTNGSSAMLALAGFGRRLLGAFVNATALVAALERERFVVIACAGKLGRFALEDAACAGWLCARLAERGATIEGAPSALARALAPRDAGEVRGLVEGSSHGRYLRRLGPEFSRDVERCAALDSIARAFELGVSSSAPPGA